MKKFKSMLVTLAMLLCSVSVGAHDFEVDGIYYNITDKKKLTVAVTYRGNHYNDYYNEYSGRVVIPQTVTYNNQTFSVTTIGEWVFYNCVSLTSITISNSVTSIGESAFNGCSELSAITIPSSVTSIGHGVFYGCASLTSVTMANSLTNIGNFAFHGCISLSSITIPNNVTSIGEYTFKGCSSLTSVNIPNRVTSIGMGAFEGCSNLKSITIPNNVTSIGGCAFYECISLTSITIPNSVTYIGKDAFMFCTSLASVSIGNGITTIGTGVFGYCSSLTLITIPYFVTDIGISAFLFCISLTSVTIPNSVTYIGNNAFRNCTSLASVTIPNSVKEITAGAFYGCSNLTSITIGNGVTEIGWEAFAIFGNIENVYCFAEIVPNTDETAFNKSYPKNTTLHVPAASINSYKSTAPWSSFGKIVALSDGDEPVVPEPEKCATPTISYINGELVFESETEGVVYHSTITDTDINSYETNKVQLNVTYNISVYATKEGYKDSEVAKATLCWIDVEPKSEGLTNTDIANVKALPVVVQANNGTITVTGADDGTMVEAYGISGAKIGEAKTTLNTATIHTDAQTGSVVIVKVGNKAIKIKI